VAAVSVRCVLGVDGQRGGWAVAVVTLLGGRATSIEWEQISGQDAAGFGGVLALARDRGAAAIGVDCPIGLPRDRWRPCDLLAKARLGRASARVFLAPPREVLAAPSYAEARMLARKLLDGKGISAQTYGLRRIVLAIDDALQAATGDSLPPVLEVHPELSFMALAGRSPGDPLPSKKLPEGRRARIGALRGWTADGVAFDPPDGDDHLDALAAAWSAARWTAGQAEQLGGGGPEHTDVDERGLPMRIVI
jgi:predicted RNase H-like nuclease